MKKLLLTCFIALTAMFMSVDMQATHLIGGNLSYEYIGQNDDGTYRYRIYSTTYTNCDDNTSNVPEPEPSIPVGIYINDPADPDGDKVLFQAFNLPLVSADTISVQLFFGKRQKRHCAIEDAGSLCLSPACCFRSAIGSCCSANAFPAAFNLRHIRFPSPFPCLHV